MDRITSSISKCSRFRRRGKHFHLSYSIVLTRLQTGMPIGLSLVSGRYRDQKLVAVAKEVANVFKGAHGGRIRELPGVPVVLL